METMQDRWVRMLPCNTLRSIAPRFRAQSMQHRVVARHLAAALAALVPRRIAHLLIPSPCLKAVPTRVKGIPPAAKVACGGGHTAVVTRSGELWVFGANGEGQLGVSCNVSRNPVMVEKLGHTRVLSIACGGSKTAAITGDR